MGEISILFHTIEKNICVGEKQHQVLHNSWDVTVTHSQYLDSNKYKRKYKFRAHGTFLSQPSSGALQIRKKWIAKHFYNFWKI
jgi:hypothetical protein